MTKPDGLRELLNELLLNFAKEFNSCVVHSEFESVMHNAKEDIIDLVVGCVPPAKTIDQDNPSEDDVAYGWNLFRKVLLDNMGVHDEHDKHSS